MSSVGKPCCTPARAERVNAPAEPPALFTRETVAPSAAAEPDADWVDIPPGSFVMGTDSPAAFAADGEGPSRRVTLGAFRMAAKPVTNRQFAQFVRETQYATEAERAGSSFVFYLQLPEAARRQRLRTP
ncbi:MAG: formylglycine-generating enzyme family protein, partial [Gammaproteobacteria bacterium]|nr:formylglycine-generating enzyme family protein [Gammaproteobacteria bacterium]